MAEDRREKEWSLLQGSEKSQEIFPWCGPFIKYYNIPQNLVLIVKALILRWFTWLRVDRPVGTPGFFQGVERTSGCWHSSAGLAMWPS